MYIVIRSTNKDVLAMNIGIGSNSFLSVNIENVNEGSVKLSCNHYGILQNNTKFYIYQRKLK